MNTKNLLKEPKYRNLILEKDSLEKETVRISGGINNGLRIILDLHSNQVSFGTLETEFNSFLVFLGRPGDFPMLKRKSLKIQPGQEHFIEVSGSITTANGIKSLSPEQRQCYFPDKDYPLLSLYSRYTAENCRLECRMKEAEKKTKCVPWYLPQVSQIFCNLSCIKMF